MRVPFRPGHDEFRHGKILQVRAQPLYDAPCKARLERLPAFCFRFWPSQVSLFSSMRAAASKTVGTCCIDTFSPYGVLFYFCPCLSTILILDLRVFQSPRLLLYGFS